MSPFTVQTLFLFYSALSFLSAILIGALFWNKKDASARLWLVGCLLTSTATSITVFRNEVPALISFSLMVFIESISVFLFSESLKRLSKNAAKAKYSWLTLIAPILLLITVELERYAANHQITPIMSATANFVFGIANIFCMYQARKVSQEFENRLFFNFFIITFGVMSALYIIRMLSITMGHIGFAFDLKTWNVIIWFFLILLGSIRNLAYIVLRLHLGFTEHSRLNNMNLKLSNILDERNNMIYSLQKLNKTASINALASTIAHEINQPLGASKLNVQFAQMKLESDPGNLKLLKELNQNILFDINRASSIVENLSRLALDKNSSITHINLLSSINEVIEISKNRLRKAKIRYEVYCPSNYAIRMNESEWQQVLINLLNNAIEALENYPIDHRKISITVTRTGISHEISIEDNGPGIVAGEESKIFELMISHKQGGTGIGLWLTKNILARVGGNIKVTKSTGGACFTIEMPFE
jgi:signal transduction histidine kinase